MDKNIKDEIETNFLLQNNSPLDEFLGFSPSQMHDLLYSTYREGSPVSLQKTIDNATLDAIPLFRIAEEYLKIIEREKQIKLTPLGALPKKVMVELYDKRFLPDQYIESGLTKLYNEESCISIMSTRLSAQLAKLVKKINGKLSLTQNGQKLLLLQNRQQLFSTFFLAFTNEFFWGYNDGFPQVPVGQLGWPFSVFMLHKFGNEEQKSNFYGIKYLKAFPQLLSYFGPSYKGPEHSFLSCYYLRTFERFFLWFGFVTVNKNGKYLNHETDKYTATDILQKVFKVDHS